MRDTRSSSSYNVQLEDNVEEETVVALGRIESYERKALKLGLEQLFSRLGGLEALVPPGSRVFLKINHLSPTSSPDRAIVTHPDFTGEIIRCLLDLNCRITLGDDIQSSHVDGFLPSGYREMSRALGVRLINLKEDGFRHVRINGRVMDDCYVSPHVLESDRLINLPKLKTHSLTHFTGAVKNMYGVIPHGLRLRLHSRFRRPDVFAEMLVDLYARVRPHLSIMDGILAMDGEGPAAGRPRPVGLVVAGRDGVAVDAAACRCVGIAPLSVDTTRLAHERSVGLGDLSRVMLKGENPEADAVKDFKPSGLAVELMSRRLPQFLYSEIQSWLMRTPFIDGNLCTSCGDCRSICPARAIHIEAEGRPAVVDRKTCIQCMCCHEVCRTGAVKLKRPLFGHAIQAGLWMYRKTVKRLLSGKPG